MGGYIILYLGEIGCEGVDWMILGCNMIQQQMAS